jgi:DNA-binding CsgD family transcriptional regulator/tetratricopeptide (TPR) repeat protein
MPASLREVLLSRVDGLPETAQRLLSVAAVGGREVEHEMLMAVADDGDAADLRVLVDSGMLEPVRAVDGDDAYSFRHALVREVIYEELLPSERRSLHRSWGQYLGAHRSPQADASWRSVELAHHWREARDRRALRASIDAGDASMASFSYDIAAREYGEALGLWDDDAPPDVGIDRVELLARGARAAYLSSEYRRAVTWSREAIDELGEGDPVRRTDLLILVGRTLWVAGDWGRSIAVYEQALETAPAEPPIVRVRALAGLAQVYMLHMRFGEARPMCEAAIEAAVEIGARDLEGHARNTYAVVLSELGQSDQALQSIDLALGIALELGIPDDIGRAYLNKAEIEACGGHPARAVATSIEGMRVAAEWGVAAGYGASIAHGAVSFAFEAGRWDEAFDLLARGDRMAGSSESSSIYRASYVSEILACRGDEAFEPLWARSYPLIVERPPAGNHGLLYLGGIEHAAFSGDHLGALDLAREVIGLMRDVDAAVLLAEVARVAAWPAAEAGRVARLAGESQALERARADMELLEETVDSWRVELSVPPGRLQRILELDAEQVRAERVRLEGTDTAGRWTALAEAWSELERPFRSAMARWRAAEAAEREGDRESALAALRETHRVATELGAAPLIGHLETMARRLRTRLGRGSPAAPPARAYGLTPRELEVLSEVAAGRTNRQIAEGLFISESTAGVHVSNILGKLGVSSRTEAARVALDQGLLGGSG